MSMIATLLGLDKKPRGAGPKTIERARSAFTKDKINTSHFAKCLGYTTAVAHNALRRLETDGYVQHQGYERVHGRPMAMWSWKGN